MERQRRRFWNEVLSGVGMVLLVVPLAIFVGWIGWGLFSLLFDGTPLPVKIGMGSVFVGLILLISSEAFK